MATGTQDYYSTLGLNKDASQDEIKRAFRKLARKHHPDLNPGDKSAEKKFKDINEAYEVLGDPQKRANYDQFGSAAFESGGGFRSQGFDFRGVEDIFSDLFGSFGQSGMGRFQEDMPVRGHDTETRIEISLEETYKGVKKPLTLTREVSCNKCKGSGAEATKTCSSCNGAGSIKQKRGFFSLSQPCPSCHGKGNIISKACGVCRGNGRTVSTETIRVKIPPGADTGSRIRLKGMGGAGVMGGPPGNLYIELTVRPHPVFKRDGHDIYVEAPITIGEAVLGGKISVPTLDGNVSMTLPAGTDSGKKFKLKGKGVPGTRTPTRGDEFVVIKIVVPKTVTAKTKDAVQEVEKAYKQK
jgi:molecular chaperone DnaJ